MYENEEGCAVYDEWEWRKVGLGVLALALTLGVTACSQADPAPISTAPPVEPQQDPIPPPDGGGDPQPPVADIEIVRQCPGAAASAVGTNSRVYAEFAKAIDPYSVTAEGLQVQCNGQPVEGTLRTEGNRLAFMPGASLAAGTTCAVTVASGMRDTEGAPLEAGTWGFTVGEGAAFDWSFRPRATVPATVSPGIHRIRKVLYEDGRLIVVIAVGTHLYVALSEDSAASFQISDPIDVLPGPYGTVEETDAAYANGRLHLFWRAAPLNSPFSEVWYTHSTTNPITFQEPEMISSDSDYKAGLETHLTLDGDRVFLTWRDECPYSDQCPFPDSQGLHMIVRNGERSLLERSEQLAGINKWDPLFAWVNGRLVMTWVDANLGTGRWAVQAVDYASGLAPVDEIAAFTPYIRSRYFFETASGNGVVHWQQGESTSRDFYLSDYDSASRTFSEPRLLFSAPRDQHLYCSRISTDPSRNLVWLSALGGKFAQAQDEPTPVERVVRFSTDNGATFGKPIPLDFLLPYKVSGPEHNSDDVCPVVAAGADGELFVVWEHREAHDGSYSSPVQATSGTPVPECSL